MCSLRQGCEAAPGSECQCLMRDMGWEMRALGLTLKIKILSWVIRTVLREIHER